jgi:transcriptional regulator with XRE-family HTH domain
MRTIDIKKLRNDIGMTQVEFANKIGIGQSYLSEIEKGRRDISKEVIAKLQDGFDREYLIKFETGKTESERNIIPLYDDVSSIGGTNEVTTNMQGTSAPSEYIDTGDWFREATAAIRHYGDSMIEYPPGCILALKEVNDRGLIIPGRDYVIETTEYRITKRVQRGKDSEHITAYSTNPEKYADGRLIHEPFDIPLSAIRHISLVLGYVVKKSGGTIVYSSKAK